MPEEKEVKDQKVTETPEMETPDESTETTEEESETTEESPESDEEELSEKELVESKNLYKLLKNPQTARQVVAAMAAQYNLINQSEPMTRREEAGVKKEIKDIF